MLRCLTLAILYCNLLWMLTLPTSRCLSYMIDYVVAHDVLWLCTTVRNMRRFALINSHMLLYVKCLWYWQKWVYILIIRHVEFAPQTTLVFVPANGLMSQLYLECFQHKQCCDNTGVLSGRCVEGQQMSGQVIHRCKAFPQISHVRLGQLTLHGHWLYILLCT